MNAILAHDKCSCDIDIDDPLPVEVVQEWLQENNIQVLNIAGNTERQAPGIEKIVVDYLIKVLQEPATVGS